MTRLTCPRTVRLAAVALVAGTVVALSGCQPITAGAAAVVEGQRLRESTVQQDVAALVAQGGAGGAAAGALRRAAVQRWVYGEIVKAAARAERVTVTDAQVNAQRAAIIARSGEEGFRKAVLASGVPVEGGYELLRMVVTLDALGAALVPAEPGSDPLALSQQRQAAVAGALVAQAQRLDIAVNPRYGSFDVASGSVVPTPSGGLAVDAGSLGTAR